MLKVSILELTKLRFLSKVKDMTEANEIAESSKKNELNDELVTIKSGNKTANY